MFRGTIKLTRRRPPTHGATQGSPDSNSEDTLDFVYKPNSSYVEEEDTIPADFEFQDLNKRAKKAVKAHIASVREQEREAARSWARLQQVYHVVLSRIQKPKSETPQAFRNMDGELGLRGLLQDRSSETSPSGVILRDLQNLVKETKDSEGLGREVFLALGEALRLEMDTLENSSSMTEQLGSQVFEDTQSVAVNA